MGIWVVREDLEREVASQPRVAAGQGPRGHTPDHKDSRCQCPQVGMEVAWRTSGIMVLESRGEGARQETELGGEECSSSPNSVGIPHRKWTSLLLAEPEYP